MSIESESEQLIMFYPDRERRESLGELVDFTTKTFLAPYLDSSRGFVSSDLGAELQSVIPDTINKVLSAAGSVKDIKLTMGGSAAGILFGLTSPDLYWSVRGGFGRLFKERGKSLEKFPPIHDAFRLLANTDPDLDLFVEEGYQLGKIFEKLHRIYEEAYGNDIELVDNAEERSREFEVKIGEHTLKTSLGPAYKGGKIGRLWVQLRSDDGQNLFHIDVTAKHLTLDQRKNERRIAVGTMHDCRADVDLSGDVSISPDTRAGLNGPSRMMLSEKPAEVWPGMAIREMRYQFFKIASDKSLRDGISLGQLFPLMVEDNISEFKKLFSNRGTEILNDQVAYQRRNHYRELFILAQVDPFLTVKFLVDTGMDALFFGRHLTKSEYSSILFVLHLGFQDVQRGSGCTLDEVDDSRRQYLDLDPWSDSKDGCFRFVSAIGSVLNSGENYSDDFEAGAAVFDKPNLPEPKFLPTDASDKIIDEMYAGIQQWGSLSESYSYKIFSEKYHYLYSGPNGQQRFNKDFLLLRLSGALNSEVSNVVVDGQKKQVVLYYPVTDQYDPLSKQPSDEDLERWSTLATGLKFQLAVGEKLPNGFEEDVIKSLMDNFGLDGPDIGVLKSALIEASKLDNNSLIADIAELVSKALHLRKRLATPSE